MRSVLLLVIALIPILGSAQLKEFEGEIRYVHLFKYKKYVQDTAFIVSQFGNSSYFLYKKGNYALILNGAELQREYSSNSTRKVYTKFKNSDTLFLNKAGVTDTILQFTIKKNADVILGMPVHLLTIVTAKKADKNKQTTRRLYYNEKKLPYLPAHASHLYANADNEVFKIMKAIPLRIEVEVDSWPFIIRYEAVRVIPRIVNPSELQFPKGAKFKN